MAGRLREPGRDAQLLALGAVAPRHPAGVLAPDPGARGLGRHRSGRPLVLPDPPHAGRRELPRPGPGDPGGAAGHPQPAARSPGRRAGHDRVRGAPHAGIRLLSALDHGAQPRPEARIRCAEEPPDRAQCARRGAAPDRGQLRPADRLPPPGPAAAAQHRPLRDAHARRGVAARLCQGRTGRRAAVPTAWARPRTGALPGLRQRGLPRTTGRPDHQADTAAGAA